MQIVHELGGIKLRDAYTLIKAISKKKKSVIDANRPLFIENAVKQGLDAKSADELFELILKFAGYGFNKSHSTGYAIVAYQTAFLKTYFPSHYMAAVLTFESQAQKVADWAPYLDDCKRAHFVSGKIGVEVRPPDVNRSEPDFTVVYEEGEPRTAEHGHVRFGLRAIKGVATKAIEAIVAERRANGPYTSLHEFCERVPQGAVNRATIEALIKSGAFDTVHGADQRSSMVATIETAVAAGASAARDKAIGQNALFGGGFGDAAAEDAPAPALIKTAPWSAAESLAYEKETLGMYVSSHPLDRWAPEIEALGGAATNQVKDRPQDGAVLIAGLVQGVRTIVTRSGRNPGRKMCIVTVEDRLGAVECVLFPDAYAQHEVLLEAERVLVFAGRVDHTRGDTQVIVETVIPIEQARTTLAKGIEISINDAVLNGATEQTLSLVCERLRNYAMHDRSTDSPAVPVTLALRVQGRRVMLEAGNRIRVRPTDRLIGAINETVGAECVRVLTGAPTLPEKKQFGRRPRA